MNFYRTNFFLKQDWKYSQQDIDNMLPYEKELEILLILQRIEERKKEENSMSNGPLPTKQEFEK